MSLAPRAAAVAVAPAFFEMARSHSCSPGCLDNFSCRDHCRAKMHPAQCRSDCDECST